MQYGRGFCVRASGIVAMALALLQAGCGGGPTATGGSGEGKIDLTVTGLPAGAAPRVVVIGPDNAVHNANVQLQVVGLGNGQYTVTALHVAYGGQDYTGTASPSVITVNSGAPILSTITYTGHPLPTIDFQVARVRLFQSVQNDADGVPIVAGRPLFIQVFATGTEANSSQLKVRLHFYHSGTLFDSLTLSGPVAVPTAVDLSSLAASWSTTIPATRVVPGLGIDAVVDPDDKFGEALESNNRFPSNTTIFTPQVVTVPTLKVVLVPVHQATGSGSVSAASQASFMDQARHIYPLSTLTATVRATFSTQADVLENNDDNGAWGQILSEINALRVSDHSTATYYGVVHPNYSSGVAGLGYVGLPAAIGWDKGSDVGGVAAHELGHTFGREHAPCGNPSGPDPDYPYAGATIGVWGYDQSNGQLKSPTGNVDLMSYCSPVWISDYNYLAVLNHFLAADVAASGASAPGLLVWGRIIGDSLVLEPALQVDAPAHLPGAAGAYRVTGTAADGSATFDLRFDGDRVPDLPMRNERHFAFVIPMPASRAAALKTITLTSPARRTVQSAALAGNAEAVVRRTAGDRVEVTWDPQLPMAVVRDATSGQIVAFGRHGRAEVETRGDVTVDVSRGTHSQPAQIRKR